MKSRIGRQWENAFDQPHFTARLSDVASGELFRGADWAALFSGLMRRGKRLRCADAVGRCLPLLEKIAPEPEEGWLSCAYHVACQIQFPHLKSVYTPAQRDGAVCLLQAIQLLLGEERAAFDPMWDFAFCTAEEVHLSDRAEEYQGFLRSWREDYVYELMRLSCEATPFSTLPHIAGVHHVAMTVSRELAAAGAPVDPALVSAASACHDIGKFGCRAGEKVPYLHYYYTDGWCVRRGLASVGHIAANHSTWDLELENLSMESLCLIYADFRVKEDGAGRMKVFPLEESFQVILSKLDNVDQAKRLRYEYVYLKLHDFEDYMRSLGVDVTLLGRPTEPRAARDTALMSPDEAVEALRMMAVEHNLQLMHRFGHERLFGNLLEAARSEKSWTKVRAYLSIFEEYFTYLNATQKTQTLGFLYELLMFPEGDIRRQAAALIGRIIARFNLGYRKELPPGAGPTEDEETQFALWGQYLLMLVSPDHKLTPWQKKHIRYALKIVVERVLEDCRSQDTERFIAELVQLYKEPGRDEEAAFALLDALYFLPMDLCGDGAVDTLLRFTAAQLPRESLTLRAAALRFLLHAVQGGVDRAAKVAERAECGGSWALKYLRDAALGHPEPCPPKVASELFLDNLKSSTPWVLKDVNIRLLETQAKGDMLHIATHFSNLIKVSETIVVRYSAGESLLRIARSLSYDQRNEVAVELTKGLEVGQYEFSKYIPQCLGEFCLFLRPSELDETIERLGQLLSSPNDSVVSASLTTVGVVLEHYAVYPERFHEPERTVELRRRKLAGMLLKGLASYRSAVRQEAMWVFGRGLFGSDVLSEADKEKLFTLVAKKLLFLFSEYPGGELTLFYRAAALSHLYRFLIRHQIAVGDFPFERRSKVAFFPGTFDPFTLSHKGIVREIRDMGFEVFLAVDEFSWSKKTQPSLVRRQIVGLSVADEFHVHLFPHDIPVNIANPHDLHRLRRLFAGRELYLAVGSDVIAGASSYRAEPVEDSVHSLNHIVFRRQSSLHGPGGEADLSRLTGKVVELQLPTHLEDISSTQIRENIDLNRDISNLIDPAVQEFIYQNGLYLREPQYKPLMHANPLRFDYVEHPARELLEELAQAVEAEPYQRGVICRELFDDDDAVMILRMGAEERILGFAALRSIRVAELYSALGSREQADYIRNQAAGRLLLLTGLYKAQGSFDTEQLLLTEVLARALNEECSYGLFCPRDGSMRSATIETMQRQGFVRTPDIEGARPAMLVDMRSPVVLLQNMETAIKAPFSTNKRVLEAVRLAHRRLQTSVTGLYPGTLLLSLNAQVIHHRLVEKITAINGVSAVPETPRKLGENMCVPFGKLLRGSAVPNTVTKTIHTDKVYTPDLKSMTIEAFPYYAPLPSQVRTVKSFGRPVILVDDLLHSGDRIRVLDPLIRAEQLQIREVLVGFLSGRGRDLMETRGRPVDCVYFVPNLQAWFVESTLYPFIGGDTVRREGRPGLVPSINMILPYTYPAFHQACDRRATFEFSRVCLENSRDILLAIEGEYRSQFGKNLTLSRLSEAVILPLCPDKGGCMHYDPALAASEYLENDLAQLMRLRKLFD
ncbi:cytidyltransferase-related domain protein [Oscillibacter hominis]|uniref:nicotinate-nucleotide adenylyltransferase n=1 Tax=Oscillibacter hominis TaxID=2763056 RepID=A0A7G9B516_9FIRM|nr:cytidyltransferase-related domain protein [Oscillibacter hominis]QNL44647.1 cytidyltransferase-related domain protein [Oscillibacter hominis]